MTMTETGWDLAIEGMERSYSAAPEEWKILALNAVYRTAKEMALFTADDVWKRCPELKVNSAIGHVLREAKSNGWIESTGDFRYGTRPAMHCKPVPIWKSLIYE